MTKEEIWDKTLNYLQFIGFAIVIAALPLSNFFMSFGIFWLAGVWVLQLFTDVKRKRGLNSRFQKFARTKSVWLLTALYALPLIGLLWTSDFDYAFWDLRMKLPLLFMPILFFSLDPISTRQFRALFGIFISSLIFAVTWCLFIYWGINPKGYTDVRDISVFISHIRFSLLIVLGLCIVFHQGWDRRGGKLLSLFLAIYFIYFLVIIGSLTGFIVLGVLGFWWGLSRTVQTGGKLRWAFVALLIVIPSSIAFYFYQKANDYFSVEPIVWEELETHSTRGEAYEHHQNYPLIEQGHYVYTHVAPKELREAWIERTGINPDGTDAQGQIIQQTLIRYLASKDLRKDYDGVFQLTNNDISAILKGYVDHDEVNMNALKIRFDDILFEYSCYKTDGNPTGHSLFQRFEFWKAAWGIISSHPIIGVGTGDVKDAYALQYEKMNSLLDLKHRLRGHNQYLTMWVTYGIFGFLFFILAVFYPLFSDAKGDYLFTAFAIISAISFLAEDTLETQAGVMFFGFFYLFLLLRKKSVPPLVEKK